MLSKTNREICGNCEFWSGGRVPIFTGEGVPKNNITDKFGSCINYNSKLCDKTRKNDSGCKDFSKWPEIL